MSYSIYIGDAQRASGDPESEQDAVGPEWFVPRITLPDAPRFDGDEMTGQSNARHPSYLVWGNFVDTVGLTQLFFDMAAGLMRNHPGCVFLTTEHYQTVKDARVSYELKHPAVQPGWNDGQDSALARLLWLEWWMFTTLNTAEVPAIYNY